MASSVLLLIGSGFLHVLWNLFAKKSINKSVFLWSAQCVAIVVYSPFLLMELADKPVYVEGIPWLIASISIHGLYFWLLAKTYTLTDLSVAYPIMRGTAPLVVPLVGVFIMGEHLTELGWLGVGLIVSGIAALGDFRKIANNQPSLYRSLGMALGIGLLVSAYTLVDLHTLSYIPPITLNISANIGNCLFLTWIVVHSQGIRQEWKINGQTIVIVGIISFGGYLLYLYAMPLLPISHITPLREIGTVFASFFGVVLLKERSGIRRIIASIGITCGILLLGSQT